MRAFICLLAALCVPSCIHAADAPSFTPAQQAVLKSLNASAAAGEKRDWAAWSRYVADDCVFSDDSGHLITKAQMLERNKKNWPLEYDQTLNRREFVVHVYGETAVVNFRATVHEQFTDSVIVTELRETETWIKRNRSWQMVARQWGPLPVNLHKPAAANAGAYKDYAGQYKWRPLDDVDIVTVKDGKLWSQIGQDEGEYLPLGPDTFFTKDDLGTITFLRDAQGHVTGYTYRRNDGQEIHVWKVK
jgi:ketosteroid isomerase-like protein